MLLWSRDWVAIVSFAAASQLIANGIEWQSRTDISAALTSVSEFVFQDSVCKTQG